MIDFSFSDPRLLFPNITESFALTLDLITSLLRFLSAIIVVIAEWKMFKKFGEKPWKSIIPFYNTYLVYKYTWKKSSFWMYFITSFLFNASLVVSNHFAERIPGSEWMSLIVILGAPFGIVAAVCSILFTFRTAEAFGKKKLFSVGPILFYPIFISILGFGKAKYVGNGEPAVAEIAADESESKAEVV